MAIEFRLTVPPGMYVVPSPESLLVWDCVFFVHQGNERHRVRVDQGGTNHDRVLRRRHPQIPPHIPD
jgi:hypothetical protein